MRFALAGAPIDHIGPAHLHEKEPTRVIPPAEDGQLKDNRRGESFLFLTKAPDMALRL